MNAFQQFLTIGFGLVVLIAVAKLFTGPFRWALRLALNTVLGFAALLVFNMVGGGFGITLGLTLFNVLVVGILGLPGFALLLVIKWLF
jgi:inhibitor of the pro-sigma K processing machinery